MPVRATKRGAERTPLSGDFDVVICGASFAGLTVARELRGTGARVLVLDRYEIGERQTSACAAPTDWLAQPRARGSILQTFGSLLVHTPGTTVRWPIGWTFSTFDYRRLCALLWEQRGAGTEFETAKVDGRTGTTVHTDRGDVSAPLLVDALGWRRVLGRHDNVQPPEALLSRGLEVHPGGTAEELELWIHKGYVRAGYGWSFPAGDEVRIGVGSFDPRDHVKEPTVRLTEDLGAAAARLPGQLDPPPAAPGGRGRRVLRRRLRRPLPAAVGRGHPHRLLLRHRRRSGAGGRAGRVAAGTRPRWSATPPSRRNTAGSSRCSSAGRTTSGGCAPAPATRWSARCGSRRLSEWAFGHYLRIAPPEFALPAPPAAARDPLKSAELAA